MRVWSMADWINSKSRNKSMFTGLLPVPFVRFVFTFVFSCFFIVLLLLLVVVAALLLPSFCRNFAKLFESIQKQEKKHVYRFTFFFTLFVFC